MDFSGNAGMEKASWAVRLVAEIVDYVAWSVVFLLLGAAIVLGALVGGGFGIVVFLRRVGSHRCRARVGGFEIPYMGRASVSALWALQVVSAQDGRPLSWAANFVVRGILVKGLVVLIDDRQITIGIFTLLNDLWRLWDANRHTRGVGGATLHRKEERP